MNFFLIQKVCNEARIRDEVGKNVRSKQIKKVRGKEGEHMTE